MWVVPGSDPLGAPGQPLVGQRAFLWARVQNLGSTAVTNASVRFWWANPSSTMTRSTAQLVGTSGVALEPEEIKEVLCLSPWIPTGANGGHLCLFAEAFSPADPLPPHTDRTPFDPVGDRHLAQRNVNVLLVAPRIQQVHESFLAGAGREVPTTVVVRRISLEGLGRDLLHGLGLGQEKLPDADVGVRVSVGQFHPGLPVEPSGKERFELPGDGEPRLLALVAELDRPLDEGAAVLVVAEEVEGPDELVVGGVALLLVGAAER